ncbi:longistatin-like isoform X2 [Haemaphysalis longicornis]
MTLRTGVSWPGLSSSPRAYGFRSVPPTTFSARSSPGMLGDRWLTMWVLLAAALWYAKAEMLDAEADPTFDELEDIRNRYSAIEIVRDTEHIKRDLSRVLDLAQHGDLDTEETTFLFMRMHDFDDNNMLDGLELIQAFAHLLEHNNETRTEKKLVAMVDNLFTIDTNQDGFVSFPEWLSYIRSVSAKDKQSTEGEDRGYRQEEATHPHQEQ